MFSLGLALAGLMLAATTLRAQDQEKSESKPKAKLSKGDLKMIRPLYLKAMEKGNNSGVRKLREALEKWSEKKGVGDALADTEAWNTLHAEHHTARMKAKKMKKGVSVSRVSFKVQGEAVEFEYAVSVPKKYDPKVSWPVILCFHDRKSARVYGTGKDYINKVWLANKATRAVADKFIIIAPTISDKSRKSKNAAERDFKWFDALHAQAMVRPLRTVQQSFNIDIERVFVEGSGRGATMALELAALFGIDSFAGVIARQGVLQKKALFPGLAQLPTLLIHRKPHKKERDGKTRAEEWAAFKKIVVEQKWNAEILELDAPEKLNTKVLGGQIIDPVWDAADKIAAFIEGKKLEAYPPKMRIVTDNPIFRSASYVRINGHDIGREKNEGAIDILFEIDKEANTIRVTGDGVHSLSFFLNDEILDLDRPVRIFANGIPVIAKIPARSVSEMIRSMRGRPYDTVRFKTTTIVVTELSPAEQNAKTEEGDEKKEEEKS
ncbi:MAG: hypothetical protein V3W41_06885 [Planctomycetota bacterium]